MTVRLKRLGEGQRVTATAYNALVDAVNLLLNTTVAAPLVLKRTPAGLHLALASQPRLELVEVEQPLAEGDTQRLARALTFDAAADGDKWTGGGREVTSLVDVQGGLYLPGERRLCLFHPGAGRFVPCEAAQWHLGVLDEPIEPGGSAAVSVYQQDADGTLDDSGHDVTGHDWLLPAGMRLPAGAKVVIGLLAHSRRWIVLESDTCPERVGS